MDSGILKLVAARALATTVLDHLALITGLNQLCQHSLTHAVLDFSEWVEHYGWSVTNCAAHAHKTSTLHMRNNARGKLYFDANGEVCNVKISQKGVEIEVVVVVG